VTPSRSAAHAPTVVLAVALALAGCQGAGEGGSEPACTAGQQIECTCTDGRRGAQRCRLDGTAFTTCHCEGPVGRDLGREDTDRTDLLGGDAREDAGPGDDAATTDGTEDRAPDPEPDATPDAAPDVADEPPSDDPGGPDIERLARLGEDCDRAGSCESDVCLGTSVGGTFYSVCAAPCCHEEECPVGFGCLQAGAGRYCLPSRIFPASFTFDRDTGEPCNDNPNACRSGICDSRANLCRGTCCTDDECISAPCHWSATGSSLRLWCDPLGLLSDFGVTGDSCTSEFSCLHGICAQSGSPPSFRCAAPCCGNGDCPGGTMCGLVAGIGGAVVRACVENPTGSAADGTPCSDDGESCAGGHCIEGACRRVCCTDADCGGGGQRCLPRTYEDVLVPVCTRPDE
jgi:hypothetical protein